MRFGRVILVRLFGSAVDIAAFPNLTDVRAGMSAYRRIPDAAADGAEGRSLTLLGPSTYSRFQPEGDVRRVGGTATARTIRCQRIVCRA